MRSKPRTAAEKRWHNDVVEFAKNTKWLLLHYGQYVKNPYIFHLDHVFGAQTKLKIEGITTKVGEWVVVPVPVEIHSIEQNHPLHKSHNPANFRATFGDQRQMWLEMITKMKIKGYELPFGDDVIKAVMR